MLNLEIRDAIEPHAMGHMTDEWQPVKPRRRSDRIEGFGPELVIDLDAVDAFRGEALDRSLPRRPIGHDFSHRPTWRVPVQHRAAAEHSRTDQTPVVQTHSQLGHTRFRRANVADGRNPVRKIEQREKLLIARNDAGRRVNVNVDQPWDGITVDADRCGVARLTRPYLSNSAVSDDDAVIQPPRRRRIQDGDTGNDDVLACRDGQIGRRETARQR